MDALIAELSSGLSTLALTLPEGAAKQAISVLELLVQAVPGIKAGVLTLDPFWQAFMAIVTGGKVDDDTFASIIAGLRAQIAIMDQQVADDDAATAKGE